MIFEKIAMPENVQLFPSDKILVPLDKLANSVFKQKNREATERAIYEDKRLGIVTTYDLEFLKGFLTLRSISSGINFSRFAVCGRKSAEVIL